MAKIVIALGGNALGDNPKEQQKLIKKAVQNLVPLVKRGNQIVITHGNGPQVGVINLAFEDSYENEDIPYMPFVECTAMSQGYIGYHIQKGLRSVLEKSKIKRRVVSIVTQVVVDGDDSSFKNPSKPVGPFYTENEVKILEAQTGEKYVEDSGRGYRKVVASPKPLRVVEIDAIKDLLKKNYIVIAGGGGGIPILKNNEDRGANAVIDKDKVSALIAKEIKADTLIILTNVKQVELNYNTPNAVKVDEMSVSQAKQYIKEGQFASGSMLPKIEAAISFVEGTKHKVIITSLNNLNEALQGKNRTIIHK